MDSYGEGVGVNNPGLILLANITKWVNDYMSESIATTSIENGGNLLAAWAVEFWSDTSPWTEDCQDTLRQVYDYILDNCGPDGIYEVIGGTGTGGGAGSLRDVTTDPFEDGGCGLTTNQVIAHTIMWWIANQFGELNPPPAGVNTAGYTTFFSVNFAAEGEDPCNAPKIPGCTDPTACNYDDTAEINDGSCEFTSCSGCMQEEACNYDPEAVYEYPKQCDFISCAGCTDPNSCTYDPDATIDDESCQYLDACGICGGDNSECSGCTDNTACNYDPSAIVDDIDACDFTSCVGCTNPCADNYDPTATISNDSSCLFGAGCLDPEADNYVGNLGVSLDCIQYYTEDGSCTYTVLGCTDPTACNYNPDATADDGTCDTTTCAGCTNSSACNYDPNATIDDGSCEYVSCLGCTDQSACNYDPDATQDDGTCEFGTCAGCLDPEACNYDPSFTIEDNTLCVYPTRCVDVGFQGINQNFCPIPLAAQYGSDFGVPLESLDAGSSTYYTQVNSGVTFQAGYAPSDQGGGDLHNLGEGECYGACGDENACNYDPDATFNNIPQCLYVDECGECGGDGIADGACDCDGNVIDECGVCGGSGIPDGACDCDGNLLGSENCSGCLDPTACNFNPNVSLDCAQSPDGSDNSCCVYVDDCGNCPGDPNYPIEFGDSSATTEAGDPCDCNGNVYDECLECPGNVDYVAQSCYGCTDPVATNYNPTATIDDGSCEFAGIGDLCRCTDSTALNYNAWYAANGPAVSVDENINRCLIYNESDQSVTTLGGVEYLPDNQGFNPSSVTEAQEEVCDMVGISYDGTSNNICHTGTCWDTLENPTWETDQFWQTGCPADLNGDGSVSTADLLELLTAFGQICDNTQTPPGVWTGYGLGNPYCPADFDLDSAVTTADLLTFLSTFGFVCGDQTGNRNTPDGRSRCQNICDIYATIAREVGLVISIEQLALSLDCDVETAVKRCGGYEGKLPPEQSSGGSKLPYATQPSSAKSSKGRRRGRSNTNY